MKLFLTLLWTAGLPLACLLWLIYRAAKKSHDPGRLIVRWITTGILFGPIISAAIPLASGKADESSAIAALLVMVSCGLIIGLIWAPSLAEMIFSPLTNALIGGNEPPELKPVYSSAQAKCKRGLYREAITEIKQQLEKFPNDFEGQLLIAEIQSENLKDISLAATTIEQICHQPEHPPARIFAALQALADWQCKHHNFDSAEITLKRITELMPDSSFSQIAAQRLAKLRGADETANARERTIELKPFEKNVGLRSTSKSQLENTPTPNDIAAQYVAHLQEHPLDAETREKLASLYAEEMQRLDLAQMELEELLSQTNHPAKQMARWLNLLADWQVKFGGDIGAASATVQRIIDSFPGTSAAEMAKTRLAYLQLELKGRNAARPTLKLGKYEKDLGLKKPH